MSLDARFQRRVQRYGWDRAAGHYERFWAAQLRTPQDRLMRLAELQPGQKVLDLACGTGLLTFRAADAVSPAGEVAAADISQEMVDQVTRAAQQLGLKNVRAERMDAEELRFPDECFDVVLCGFGLMYAADPGAALREVLRVLKPGGRMFSVVWGARNRCGWAEIFPIVERRIQSEVCPLFFQLGTGESLELEMRETGFVDISTERESWTLHYESGEDACGAAFAGGPVALAYSRFDEQTREEACAEYLASIDAFRSGREYTIPGEFVLARGTRPA